MKYYLHFKNVTFNSGRGNVFEIKTDIIYIGRSSVCNVEIPVNYTSVSRKHFVVQRKQNKFYVADLGSSNGTFLNGFKLVPNKFYEWRPQSTISISTIYITLVQNNTVDTGDFIKSTIQRIGTSSQEYLDKLKTKMLDTTNEPDEGSKFLSKISKGGMSEIIKAKFLDTKEIVAIKIPNSLCVGNQAALQNFIDEITMSLHFRHENVIQTYMRILYRSNPAMVMEYFPSVTLRSYLLNQTIFDYERLRNIALQIMSGLEYIHGKKILHNDIKPSNILIDDNHHVKINDFGAAYMVTSKIPKSVIGTVSYMSPDRINHGNKKTFYNDIYSLGVVLYEMYTKKHPFMMNKSKISTDEIKKTIITGDVLPPIEVNSDIPTGINDFILRCMHKDSKKRFKNVSEMKAEFQKH